MAHKRWTTEIFIEKANQKHGVGTFDYSQVNYVNARTKINIKCNICNHNMFIRAGTHLKSECKVCSDNKQSYDTSTYVKKAEEVHGNTYDYSLVDYKRSNMSVDIICKDHGVFSQTANRHLQGHGCPKCGAKSKTKKTTESFIQECKELKTVEYDYSKVDYKGNKEPIVIRCVKHDVWFSQAPITFLKSDYPCPECLTEHRRELKYTTEEAYLERANEVHNNLYFDYDFSDYNGLHSKIKYECEHHGLVRQNANSHLRGVGCPNCTQHGFKKDKPATFYIQVLKENNIPKYIKFGVTNKDLNTRMRQQSNRSIFEHELVKEYLFEDGTKALQIENHVKYTFKDNGLCCVTKREMEDGYTETLPVILLDTLIEEIEGYIL